ncbi:preprotein translocase subunit YajC [Longirhabdus pacifica]|uniref:preprotein translocase subunit YajC n=1 Tax=Longirhabdus pacifica TaxID=2305227 RepID=UPI0010087378|nr:preprotein translocase subunit YajC [Longirhabdus pacifica]
MNFVELASDTGQGSIFASFVPLILIVVIFYFLLIRPQQKKQKQRNMMLLNLEKGDKVVTIGGIHGTILEIDDDTVVLRINDATKVTFDRAAINNVASQSSS